MNRNEVVAITIIAVCSILTFTIFGVFQSEKLTAEKMKACVESGQHWVADPDRWAVVMECRND
jgi:hypothetical protein